MESCRWCREKALGVIVIIWPDCISKTENKGYRIIYTPAIRILHKISPEARVDWKKERFYYHVRNALYINYKFKRSLLLCMQLAVGYLIRGLYNQVFLQVVRAVKDVRRLWRCPVVPDSSFILTPEARSYFQKCEGQFQDPYLKRMFKKVFFKVPQTSKA